MRPPGQGATEGHPSQNNRSTDSAESAAGHPSVRGGAAARSSSAQTASPSGSSPAHSYHHR